LLAGQQTPFGKAPSFCAGLIKLGDCGANRSNKIFDSIPAAARIAMYAQTKHGADLDPLAVLAQLVDGRLGDLGAAGAGEYYIRYMSWDELMDIPEAGGVLRGHRWAGDETYFTRDWYFDGATAADRLALPIEPQVGVIFEPIGGAIRGPGTVEPASYDLGLKVIERAGGGTEYWSFSPVYAQPIAVFPVG